MIANEETLKLLMIKAQGGDKQCYSSLLVECEKWLRRYYARKINPAAIDDLVQETLISLHRKRSSYDSTKAFLPWLAAIGRYRWIDSLRKIYRHDHDELYEEMVADPQDEDVTAKVSLERLLGMIPDKQAEVINLVKIEGLSIHEAASMTGQTESLVKVNIHRGLKKMSALIESA
ncbi:sigma-70 family RNA polymerase sigma factor [Parasphingorhabdus halotolerans]|uniref:Sigma-70 family RNA polymerase sigma factor n=1 Tax=Parasphingorhabdus halotolerans TaxID=2725558 RepID=A0A6H2DSQ9_9SPHN|nr:sigma-70 family RNA polymerase sigma factor [Parasphingorhabdus halotolerans]QJB70791.1 sigma-70 family RNA polymerase sigma factor [Parasphingorhabdus halotolerans]